MADEEYEVYELGDYRYKIYDTASGECEVEVIDKTKSSYENMPATIVFPQPGSGVQYTLRVTGLYGCFSECTNLVSSPSLSSNVSDMRMCFRGCTSLANAPAIPSSVELMSSCFYGCTSLTTPPNMESVDNVTNLADCFRDCASLITAPVIPSSVKNLQRCFYGCTSLITPPIISSNVTILESCFNGCSSLSTPPNMTNATGVLRMAYCFKGCTSLTTPPVIPSLSITSLSGCFQNCTSLTTAPTIPTRVTMLAYCFNNCDSLTTAPAIPASVRDMTGCFLDCGSLDGNIEVNTSDVSDYGSIFDGTLGDIYIINGAGTSAVETLWKTIASGYSNVHYEADDNPSPALSMSVARVDTAVSETPSPTGEYAFIKATAVIYDTYIPDGWSVVYDEDESITKDNVLQSPYWTRAHIRNTYTLKCWLSLGDTSKHTFTLQVSDSIKDANDNVKVIQLSPVITQILSKAYKLVDYYHDPTTQTEGMSIGKFATEANLFDVDMPALFRNTVSLKDNNSVIRQLFDFIYPVGSYYETSDVNFNPNDTWGGTWVRETAGIVHVSASIGTGTDYEVIGAPSDTQDGGEKTHELTAGETGIRNHVHAMGAHTHNSTSGYYLLFLSTSGNKAVNRRSIKPGTGTAISNIYYGENAIERGSVIGGMTSATNTGNPTVGEQSGSAHNNMQPYINVVRWHRTA